MVWGTCNQDVKTKEPQLGCCYQIMRGHPSLLLLSLLTDRTSLHFSQLMTFFLPTHCMSPSFSYMLCWCFHLLMFSYGKDDVDMGFPCAFNRFLPGIHWIAHYKMRHASKVVTKYTVMHVPKQHSHLIPTASEEKMKAERLRAKMLHLNLNLFRCSVKPINSSPYFLHTVQKK